MMIAVILARAMQMAIYQIVGVIGMGHGFVSAFWSVLVGLFVTIAIVIRCTYGFVFVGIF
jgi:hypothetical protein